MRGRKKKTEEKQPENKKPVEKKPEAAPKNEMKKEPEQPPAKKKAQKKSLDELKNLVWHEATLLESGQSKSIHKILECVREFKKH